jgi:hypothetical protein
VKIKCPWFQMCGRAQRLFQNHRFLEVNLVTAFPNVV